MGIALSVGASAALGGCGGGAMGPDASLGTTSLVTAATTQIPAVAVVETPLVAVAAVVAPMVPARGVPVGAPWVSCYGTAAQMGDLARVAKTFRVINIEADPDTGNFSPAQIRQLKNGGRNRVISYLNLGSCENFRSYWSSVPPPFVAAGRNRDETWMDLGNADYQNLMVNYVAPRLVAQGVDGFFLDNMELVEHGARDKNGPCSASCRQGGLDVVAKLRRKYPQLLIVMQNATGDVTRFGKTGGVAFPKLLDGISHEEVFAPEADAQTQSELTAWKNLKLRPGGQAFWIGTEDYVGRASNTTLQKRVYAQSRALGFSPYCADESAKQQSVFYWAS